MADYNATVQINALVQRSAFLWCSLLSCTMWFLVANVVISLRMKSLSVTIQMKATELYFPVVLFIVLYQVVITSESVDDIL